ncbi:hypothetical protein QYF61_022665 [Mycteria americana]|uniref:Reverse transcriptase domain-containing protein n=1 Tax=Mycteria americana TaxID=33587 RepID=A0AAN7PLJ9_MYCAM|nr:hypothetical protein QYF61_022665 [Mycteria americana]
MNSKRKTRENLGLVPSAAGGLVTNDAEKAEVVNAFSASTGGEVPEDCKKSNAIPFFKKGKKGDPGHYRLISLTSIPGKVMEKILLETISKLLKDKMIKNSQHGFTKGKIMLNQPDSLLQCFYNEVTSLVDEGRAVDVVYLDFRKSFDTVSHNIFADKLTKYGQSKWTAR